MRSSNADARLGEFVDNQRLADDRADRHPRVQRGERVLEDDLHIAAKRAERLALEPGDAAAFEPYLARGRLDQPQDAAPGGRFAAAGFPDQPQRLAGADLEADVVDRVHLLARTGEHAAPGREILHQVADAQQRFGHGRTAPHQ